MSPNRYVIPIEVFEAVVDQACDHLRSLRAISLTCRTFLPRARVHIFHHIHIKSKEQIHSIPVFFHERLWLLPLVRYITISSDSPTDWQHPNRLLEVVPVPLFTQLPNLCHLRLIGIGGERRVLSLSRLTLSALRIYSAPVRQLELDGVVFPSVDDLMRYLSAFPNLSHLLCGYIMVDAVSPNARLISHYKFKLTRLVVSSPIDQAYSMTDAGSRGLVIGLFFPTHSGCFD